MSHSSAQATGSGCVVPVIPYFNANPSQITQGQSSTLSWGDIYYENTKTWAQSTIINPGLGEVGSGASSRPVKPAKTTTYTLISTSGCGSTATKQVTITVSDSGGTGARVIKIDLQPTDLSVDSGKYLHVQMKNNGTYSGNITFGVSCTGKFHATQNGLKTDVTYTASSLTYPFNADQERMINTNFKLDQGVGYYDLTCTVSMVADPNPSNNSITETVSITP